KKLVRKQGSRIEVTVYIGAVFEHRRFVQGNSVQQNNALHVMDTQTRVALVRAGKPFSGETSPAVQYHLGDHLGSSNVVIDDKGAWVNREEYLPYGETTFGGFARKRYSFMSAERDEENGLSSLGARHYAPSLMRWISCDPQGAIDGINLYRYARNSPLTFADKIGTDSLPINAVDEVVPKAAGIVQHPGMRIQGSAEDKAAWDNML